MSPVRVASVRSDSEMLVVVDCRRGTVVLDVFDTIDTVVVEDGAAVEEAAGG